MNRSRPIVVLIASGAVLALGLAALAWTLGAGSSEAEQGATHNCPSPGKWSIAVWEGDDDADVDQALATCGEDAVEAAYYLDPTTQVWSRWFAGKAEVSNLDTVNDMQGVLALGSAEAPATPIGLPNPASVYCTEQGYELRIDETPAGQVGICVFTDGTECEEWSFYRGECGQQWATPTVSAQQAGTMRSCPNPGKWSIAVWDGDDATDVDEALATCGEDAVAAAYSIDPETQAWSRWFAGEPDLSTLSTLDNLQGVVALGAGTAPQTPTLAAGWTKIEPGGDTICSTGTPYAYWVHPGTVNRLVVYFQGGGACWDANTCSNPGLYYDDSVDDTDNPANREGMADLDNPENPFKDWYQVFIPYCTGDIHWGNATTTYHWGGADHTIHHKGFVNVSAVLDWIQTNFEKPEKIFVTGTSAGGYGSTFGAAYVHNLYPDVPLYQLGDVAAGVITEDFFQGGFPNWGAIENIPDWIPGLDIDWTELTMAKIYTALANYYSSDRWAQYNTAHDENQTFYYAAMGGSGDWGQLMLASIDEIQDATTNFEAYTAPGEIHGIMLMDFFYTREVNGVKFVDWLDAMVNDEPWESVTCADCETDPEAQ